MDIFVEKFALFDYNHNSFSRHSKIEWVNKSEIVAHFPSKKCDDII